MDGNKQAVKPVVRIRVRKEDVVIHPAVKQDGLSICLACWKDWMLSDDRDLSASRMKLGGGVVEEDTHDGYESDPYGEQRKADYKVGAATGAMIDDLKPYQRWAIYKGCGVSTVWNFPSVDFLSSLAAAHAELESKLRKHFDTAAKFL